jgi:hypothetical protein
MTTILTIEESEAHAMGKTAYYNGTPNPYPAGNPLRPLWIAGFEYMADLEEMEIQHMAKFS